MSALLAAALRYVDEIGPIEIAPQRESPAPGRPASPAQIAADVVTVSASLESDSLLHLGIAIAPGWHLNAHDISTGDSLVPTSLAVPGHDVTIDFPPGEEMHFPFADEPLRVYAGQVRIAVRFKGKIPLDAPLELTLSYQPCDDSTCLPAVHKRIVLAARGA
jgi:hypothetical protein